MAKKLRPKEKPAPREGKPGASPKPAKPGKVKSVAPARVSRQQPLSISGGLKRETRTQFGAIPFRMSKKKGKAGIEVLLVSSRDSGRWVIPKGWPIDGMAPSDAAAREAWEEAGVRGRVYDSCVGIYSYNKWLDDDLSLPVIVAVFGLLVDTMDEDFPERTQRRRKWMSLRKAAGRVQEPELKQMFETFTLDRLI